MRVGDRVVALERLRNADVERVGGKNARWAR
jgi:hypothetical protein